MLDARVCPARVRSCAAQVTFYICVDNNSWQPTYGKKMDPKVNASLKANTALEISIACRDSACLQGQYHGSLKVHGFVAEEGINATLEMGATPTCSDPELCGTILIGEQIHLPTHRKV